PRRAATTGAVDRRGRRAWAWDRSRFAQAEHGHERFLRDLDVADALHTLLTLALLLEQLALARDVAAVALGQHVLAHGADRLTRDDAAADGRLHRHLEQLARDELFELLDEGLAQRVGLLAVGNQREGVDGLAIDEDVQLDQVAGAVPGHLIVERG